MKGSPVRVRASAPHQSLCVCRGFRGCWGFSCEGFTPSSGGVLGASDPRAWGRRLDRRTIPEPATAPPALGRQTSFRLAELLTGGPAGALVALTGGEADQGSLRPDAPRAACRGPPARRRGTKN